MNLGPLDSPACLSCGASPDRHQPDCAGDETWEAANPPLPPRRLMAACCPHTPGGPHSALCQGNERALAATAAATVSVLTGHTGGCTCKECETLAYIRLPEVVGELAEGRVKGREEVLRALDNFADGQEVMALDETNPDARHGRLFVIEHIRALIAVEAIRP